MSATNRFKIQPTIGSTIVTKTALMAAASDADINKGVKLSTTVPDTYEFCAAGDVPEAFLYAVERHTVKGKVVVSVIDQGYRWATAGAACTVGDLVEIHEVAAQGTKDVMQRPVVKSHTKVLEDNVLWRIVSASTENGVVSQGDNYVVIERI